MRKRLGRHQAGSTTSAIGVIAMIASILVVATIFLNSGILSSPTPNIKLQILVPDGSGLTNPGTGIHQFNRDIWVQVTAVPNPDWRFDHWILDGSVDNTNPIIITMTGNHTLKAVFTKI